MNCKFCKTKTSEIAFDLGNAPPSNNLIHFDKLFAKEMTYPLFLYVCPKCFLVQIDEQLDGHEIFNDEYVYFSSASKFWLDHAKRFCNEITKKLNLTKDSFVVEIASNDGYLLKNFSKTKIRCLGIEPTKSTAQEALIKGIPTLIDFFTEEIAKKFKDNKEQADLIIANNVLAHVPRINDFVSGLKYLLKNEGTITIEFPHLLKLVKNNEFDTIYHEHYFYFSLFSLKIIFNKYNLSIYDVEEISTHGGSLRIYVTHLNNKLDKAFSKKNVNKILKKEIDEKVNSISFCNTIREKAFQIKIEALNFLVNQKKKNKKIIGFGAAAKGNTFLNYIGIKNDIIDFVVDETPYKIGKYLPQSKIPILAIDKIQLEKPDIIIILPWNHKEEIIKKLEFTKKWNAKLVIFIPKFQTY